MNISKYIPDVEDFPKKGISFKDITPILKNPKVFNYVVDKFSEQIKNIKADVILAPEARGFIFASAVAYKTKTKLVLARKENKLPKETVGINFEYEYDNSSLFIQLDDINKKDNVVIIDDVLATGETCLSLINLVEKKFQANIVGLLFILDIKKLNGLAKINKYYCNILV